MLKFLCIDLRQVIQVANEEENLPAKTVYDQVKQIT